MRKALATMALALLTACASITGTDWVYAYNARRMHAEGWYEWAYNEMLLCAAQHFTGLPDGKRYSDIEWFMVPAGSMRRPNGILAVGMYSAPNRIFLDEEWVMEAYVIYHELGHYITNIDHTLPELWVVLENECVVPLSGQ